VRVARRAYLKRLHLQHLWRAMTAVIVITMLAALIRQKSVVVLSCPDHTPMR
jgi:hypothetical protein